MIRGEKPKPFRYFDKGSMATIGRNKAVADLKFFHFSGLPAWLAWLFVHIIFLVGFRNRLLVLVQWAWAYLYLRQGCTFDHAQFSVGTQAAERDEQCHVERSKTSLIIVLDCAAEMIRDSLLRSE